MIASAAELFVQRGYEATSVDDLVGAAGVHRASLYNAFGSKRGLFLAALRRLVLDELPLVPADSKDLLAGTTLDLLLVAALELAPRDEEVCQLVATACAQLAERLPPRVSHGPATLLGRRLLQRMNTV